MEEAEDDTEMSEKSNPAFIDFSLTNINSIHKKMGITRKDMNKESFIFNEETDKIEVLECMSSSNDKGDSLLSAVVLSAFLCCGLYEELDYNSSVTNRHKEEFSTYLKSKMVEVNEQNLCDYMKVIIVTYERLSSMEDGVKIFSYRETKFTPKINDSLPDFDLKDSTSTTTSTSNNNNNNNENLVLPLLYNGTTKTYSVFVEVYKKRRNESFQNQSWRKPRKSLLDESGNNESSLQNRSYLYNQQHDPHAKPAISFQKKKAKLVKWSSEEDKVLLQVIRKQEEKGDSVISWEEVQKSFNNEWKEKFRDAKTCKNRWNGVLDPSVNRKDLTDDEKRAVVFLQGKYGNKWGKISESLPGRNANFISQFGQTDEFKRLKEQYVEEKKDPEKLESWESSLVTVQNKVNDGMVIEENFLAGDAPATSLGNNDNDQDKKLISSQPTLPEQMNQLRKAHSKKLMPHSSLSTSNKAIYSSNDETNNNAQANSSGISTIQMGGRRIRKKEILPKLENDIEKVSFVRFIAMEVLSVMAFKISSLSEEELKTTIEACPHLNISMKKGVLFTKQLITDVLSIISQNKEPKKAVFAPLLEATKDVLENSDKKLHQNNNKDLLSLSVVYNDIATTIQTNISVSFTTGQRELMISYLQQKYQLRRKEAKTFVKRLSTSQLQYRHDCLVAKKDNIIKESRALQHHIFNYESAKTNDKKADVRRLKDRLQILVDEVSSMTQKKLNDMSIEELDEELAKNYRFVGERKKKKKYEWMIETADEEPTNQDTLVSNENSTSSSSSTEITSEKHLLVHYLSIERKHLPQTNSQLDLLKYRIFMLKQLNDLSTVEKKSKLFNLLPHANFKKIFVPITKSNLKHFVDLHELQQIVRDKKSSLGTTSSADNNTTSTNTSSTSTTVSTKKFDFDITKVDSMTYKNLSKLVDMHDLMPLVFEKEALKHTLTKNYTKYGTTFHTNGEVCSIVITTEDVFNDAKKKTDNFQNKKKINKIEKVEQEQKEKKEQKKQTEPSSSTTSKKTSTKLTNKDNDVEQDDNEEGPTTNALISSILAQLRNEQNFEINKSNQKIEYQNSEVIIGADHGLRNVVSAVRSDDLNTPIIMTRKRLSEEAGWRARDRKKQVELKRRMEVDINFKEAKQAVDGNTTKVADENSLLAAAKVRIKYYKELHSFYGDTEHAKCKLLNKIGLQRAFVKFAKRLFKSKEDIYVGGDAYMPSLKGSSVSLVGKWMTFLKKIRGENKVVSCTEYRSSICDSNTRKKMYHPPQQESKKKLKKRLSTHSRLKKKEEEEEAKENSTEFYPPSTTQQETSSSSSPKNKSLRDESKRKLSTDEASTKKQKTSSSSSSTTTNQSNTNSEGGRKSSEDKVSKEEKRKKMKEKIEYYNKPHVRTVYGLYQASFLGYKKLWNRDHNAAINIVHIYRSLVEFKKEPFEFRREVKLFENKNYVPDSCAYKYQINKETTNSTRTGFQQMRFNRVVPTNQLDEEA